MIEVKDGDIFDAFADGCQVICHQVNCQGVMNAGLAKDIAKRWPEVKRDYEAICMESGYKQLLGNYIFTPIEEGGIVSIFGQVYYGRDKNRCYTSYGALAHAFHLIHDCLHVKKIAIPYGIGCGLAGGDLDVVMKIIVNEFNYADKGPDVVIYRKENAL